MNMLLGMKVLNENEIQSILDASLKILNDTGVEIENTEILKKLDEFGGIVDYKSQRVKFSKSFMEKFLSDSKKVEWDGRPLTFGAFAGVYQGYYLDPEDGAFKEWNEERVLRYAKLAQALPNIRNMFMLGCPIVELPEALKPLYEKFYCWKYGIEGGKSIWDTNLCDKIYEMWEVYAQEINKKAVDIYNGTVYLISPLKFGKVEAEQFVYFYKKGLRTIVGQLGSLGGTTPVTPAGALSLHIAEGLFVNILNRAFFDDRTIALSNSVSTLDMSSGIFQYGRPEQVLMNIAGSQLARYIGASFEGHCGLSDAKVPGHEAGVQKVYSALLNAAACGYGNIEAGLLGVDEINSPIQMILDDEITGAIKRVFEGFEVNEATLALDVTAEVGPGGTFLDTDHTAENFRQSLWQPTIWSKEMYNVWESKGKKNDVDRAKEKFCSIIYDGKDLQPMISEDAERRLLNIINK